MPKEIFIIGSTEGREHAECLQNALNLCLKHDSIIQGLYQCTAWWEPDVWENGFCTFDSLMKKAEQLKYRDGFVLSLFSPDDIVDFRSEKYCIARDNVWLEFGLFSGILGKERVFMGIPNAGSTFRPGILHDPKDPSVPVYELGRDIKFHRPSDVDGILERPYRFNAVFDKNDPDMQKTFYRMIVYIMKYIRREVSPPSIFSDIPNSFSGKDWDIIDPFAPISPISTIQTANPISPISPSSSSSSINPISPISSTKQFDSITPTSPFGKIRRW